MIDEILYICASCLSEFSQTRSEEECIKERNDLFPNTPDEEFVIVCEDCFVNIMREAYLSGEQSDERYMNYVEE
jgi:hypothetical protein